MDRPTNAREALLVDLIGDMAGLLDRVETLTPAINKARLKMTAAAQDLAAGVDPFKTHMVGIAAQTQKTAVEHIVKRTNEVAALTLRMQTQAMTESARAIIEEEVGPPLRQLASTLQALVERTHRPWWESWASYAATAAISAICSATLVLYVLGR